MLRALSKPPHLPSMACAILVGALIPAGAALAQPGRPAATQRVGPVTVTAPRWIGREANGTPIERVSMSATVRVADLDLTTAQGVGELNQRVRGVAASLCTSLEEEYPVGSPEHTACVKEAIKAASSQTRLIAVAN